MSHHLRHRDFFPHLAFATWLYVFRREQHRLYALIPLRLKNPQNEFLHRRSRLHRARDPNDGKAVKIPAYLF